MNGVSVQCPVTNPQIRSVSPSDTCRWPDMLGADSKERVSPPTVCMLLDLNALPRLLALLLQGHGACAVRGQSRERIIN